MPAGAPETRCAAAAARVTGARRSSRRSNPPATDRPPGRLPATSASAPPEPARDWVLLTPLDGKCYDTALCPSADSGITDERGPLTLVGRSLPFCCARTTGRVRV